jgi:4-amino-4-deoxy-L-arabinose transferase-like glycosyltransferase
MRFKKEHIWLICILIAGIIARIIKFSDPAFVLDTVAFSRLGKNLIEYGRYNFGENYNMGVFFPPGYPFFIGLVNLIIKDLFFSAKLVSFIASCVSIILSYLIGKKLYDEEAGLFAAFVYAFYPVILILSVDAYSDVLFFCFLHLSIYLFIISLENDNFLLPPLVGISIAASYLTRPEGQFLLLLPILQMSGVFSGKISFNKKSLLRIFVVFLLFGITISPYMLFLKNYTGKFSATGKANISILLGELSDEKEYHEVVNAPDNLYDRAAFALNDDKTELRGWNKKENLSLKDYVLKDPVKFLKRYQKNLLREVKTLNKLLLPIILPLFFAFFSRELFKNRLRLFFFIYPLFFFLMYPAFIIIEKQTLLIVVFLILFSCGGFPNSVPAFSGLVNYYGLSRNPLLRFIERNIKYMMIFILILGSISYMKYSSFDKVPRPLEHDRAGLYLKENVKAGYEEINVMSARPYVSYYSDARFTMLPYAGVSDVIHFAKLHDVNYIVIDKRLLGKWDYYNELIDMQRYSDAVELFYEDASDSLIRVFKVK